MPDDLVKLEVDGTDFSGWESLTITRTLDSCADAFSLAAPFDPAEPKVAAAFRPFGYQPARVKIDDELILTGRIESVSPSVSGSDRAINVQGRSLTGSLVDCSIDGSGYQYTGMSLLSIAAKMAKPFGIEVVSVAGVGPAFKSAIGSKTLAEAKKAISEAAAEPGQGVFEYLNKLAQDAGLLLTCDNQGRLVITKMQPGAEPSASLVEGRDAVLNVTGSYDGTQRFSRYKVLQQQDGAPNINGIADDAGVKIYRPRVETGSEGDSKDAKTAAQWRRAMSLAGAVGVQVMVAGWRTPGGALWTPGAVVTLQAPGAFILKETPFVIAEATLSLDTSQGRTTSLRLVLPATYSGTMPEVYPWE